MYKLFWLPILGKDDPDVLAGFGSEDSWRKEENIENRRRIAVKPKSADDYVGRPNKNKLHTETDHLQSVPDEDAAAEQLVMLVRFHQRSTGTRWLTRYGAQ